MPNERLVRQALLVKPTGKRPKCRPRPGWSNCVSDLAWSHLGVEPAELSQIAVDREIFHALLWILPPQQRVNKFLRRLELINTNRETARNDLPIIHDTFRTK